VIFVVLSGWVWPALALVNLYGLGRAEGPQGRYLDAAGGQLLQMAATALSGILAVVAAASIGGAHPYLSLAAALLVVAMVQSAAQELARILAVVETAPAGPEVLEAVARVEVIIGPTFGQVRVRPGSRGVMIVPSVVRRPLLCVGTESTVRLSEEALVAIVAHEAGHVKSAHYLKALLLNTISAAAVAAVVVLLVGAAGRTVGALAIAGCAAWVARLALAMMVARRFEYAADSFAARLVGADAIRSALDGLDTATLPAWMGVRSHPPRQARIDRLRLQR
jgi:Zn-dependent protease with chaperone function